MYYFTLSKHLALLLRNIIVDNHVFHTLHCFCCAVGQFIYFGNTVLVINFKAIQSVGMGKTVWANKTRLQERLGAAGNVKAAWQKCHTRGQGVTEKSSNQPAGQYCTHSKANQRWLGGTTYSPLQKI